jgi:hypothetical protein
MGALWGKCYETKVDLGSLSRKTPAPRATVGRTSLPGRSPDWLKMKNPAAPAVKREAEEDWAK